LATIICAVRGDRAVFRKYVDAVHNNFLDYETELIQPQDGKRVIRKLKMGVRPIQLFEFTFPQKCTEQALQIINPGKCWTEKYNKWFNLLRKILKLKPIPEYKKTEMDHHRFIEVVGIGYKDDKFTELGAELL